MRGPARGYSWPAFGDGNTAAERHGADSERRWRPLAEQLEQDILGLAPWLTRPGFRPAVRAWAKAEAQATLIGEWLDEHGLLDDEGEPRPAATYSLRLEASAAAKRQALGLDPLSFAKLLQTFTGTRGTDDVLESLQAEGAAILTARSPEALPAAETGDGRWGEHALHDDDRVDTPAQRTEWQ